MLLPNHELNIDKPLVDDSSFDDGVEEEEAGIVPPGTEIEGPRKSFFFHVKSSRAALASASWTFEATSLC